MKRKRYPKYKPSLPAPQSLAARQARGVEWLGNIPEHWDVEKLKYISSVQFSNVDKHAVEDEEPVRLCNYTDVYYNDFITADLELMKATATPAEINKFIIVKGDVIITKDSESWDDIAIPACVVDKLEGVLCGYHLAQIRADARKVKGKYLFRLFCSPDINYQFRVEATGVTRYGLGKYALDNALFLLPPPDEQEKITEFLDRETARINALIEKKRRQIELLQEKRAALISHVVTKGLPAAAAAQAGLNPKARMKDSLPAPRSVASRQAGGIEWLGEIPAHWDTKRLKFLLEEPLKYGANEVAEIDDPSLPRYVRITDIREDGTLRDDTFKSLPEEIAWPYLLRENDLLFARSGATVGKTFLYRESWGRAAYAGYLIRARMNPIKMLPEFAAYFSRSKNYWNWLNSSLIQATIQNVSAEKYANLVLGVPPKDEQIQIVEYLDGEIANIDGLTLKVTSSIDLLREYRTALISAAVTGKIDVRGEVA